MRLHVYLAHQGVASRRKAEQLIIEGRVRVNKAVAVIGQAIDPSHDHITVDGTVIKPQEEYFYFIVNKPKGYVSTTSDELGRKTVLDIVPPVSTRLYPVGRLDKDSEGLMLLTNDGDLSYRLTHPKFEVTKVYKVLINAEPSEKALNFLRRGIKLKEGMTRPAEVTLLNTVDEGAWLEIQIHEGKQHQVRRMLERAGYDTIRLLRLQMGPLTITDLHGKKYQELTPTQVRELRMAVGLSAAA